MTYCGSSALARHAVALLEHVCVADDRSRVGNQRSGRSRKSECEIQKEVGGELHDCEVELMSLVIVMIDRRMR
jgi:hypothetical protein